MQDANVKLIRELRTEIKRLKTIITAAKLQDSDLVETESFLEENIHKKEEMVCKYIRKFGEDIHVAGTWQMSDAFIIKIHEM